MKQIQKIGDLMNGALQLEFCAQMNHDRIDLYNGCVVGINTECTESHYGRKLFQEYIAGCYSMEEIQRWLDSEYEKEHRQMFEDAF